MKIDFNTLPKNTVPNFKGGELEVSVARYDDGHNRILDAIVIPGASVGMHTHDDSSEIIFISEGTATVICDGVEETITVGECHYCPKGSSHTLINRTDRPLRFHAVVPLD